MDLEDKISEVAQGPAKASGDAGSVEQQNLKDLIEADKYLARPETTVLYVAGYSPHLGPSKTRRRIGRCDLPRVGKALRRAVG